MNAHQKQLGLLTTEELAANLRVHPETLNAGRRSGAIKIPFIKIGGSVRYRIEDVYHFLEMQASNKGDE